RLPQSAPRVRSAGTEWRGRWYSSERHRLSVAVAIGELDLSRDHATLRGLYRADRGHDTRNRERRRLDLRNDIGEWRIFTQDVAEVRNAERGVVVALTEHGADCRGHRLRSRVRGLR